MKQDKGLKIYPKPRSMEIVLVDEQDQRALVVIASLNRDGKYQFSDPYGEEELGKKIRVPAKEPLKT